MVVVKVVVVVERVVAVVVVVVLVVVFVEVLVVSVINMSSNISLLQRLLDINAGVHVSVVSSQTAVAVVPELVQVYATIEPAGRDPVELLEEPAGASGGLPLHSQRGG